MKPSTRIVHALMFNCITSLSLCAAAQGLAVWRGMAPAFSLARLGINFCVAYPVAVLLGILFPAQAFGRRVCALLHIKPGPLYGVGMNVSISFVYTLVLSGVMTLFNVVVLAGQGMGAFLGSFLGSFVPMLLVSCLVSAVFNMPMLRLAARLTGSEPPDNGPPQR